MATTVIILSVLLYCLVAATIPRGIAMIISKKNEIRPIMKEIQTASLNFSVTGTVHFQLSPKSPLMAFPHQEKKPRMMPLSMP